MYVNCKLTWIKHIMKALKQIKLRNTYSLCYFIDTTVIVTIFFALMLKKIISVGASRPWYRQAIQSSFHYLLYNLQNFKNESIIRVFNSFS